MVSLCLIPLPCNRREQQRNLLPVVLQLSLKSILINNYVGEGMLCKFSERKPKMLNGDTRLARGFLFIIFAVQSERNGAGAE